MSSMTPEMRAKFRSRMSEQLKANTLKAAEKEAEEKKAVEEMFAKVGDIECSDTQVMFSELFFDPARIGMPDFPVDTFHHLHDEWPEWVRNSVPEHDANYEWNESIVYSFVSGDDEHRFLVGMPGSGKTTLPLQVAALTGRPVFKQSFSNDLEADEWIMSKEIDDTGTHWRVLPFVESMDYPFYVVLDEVNRLRRGGRLLLNPLLDEGGAMPLRDGRVVKPHAQWKCVATDNTRGMGDGLDKFDGDISDISTTDRFGMMLEVGYLPAAQQIKLVQAWLPEMSDEMARMIVTFGEKIVTGYKAGSFPLPWTPRRMKKAAKLALRYRNVTAGLRDAYYNFLAEDDERAACNQVLKDVGISTKFGEFA